MMRRARIHEFLHLAVFLLFVSSTPQRADAWNVLILGGTGFRGHLTTERLLRGGHNVTVISRGNSYWGVFEKLRDRIEHWKCNRTIPETLGLQGLESAGLINCTQLVNSSHFFDAVVDFSSRKLVEMKQAIKLLNGRVGVYVFMSTHNVYDVSVNATHDGPLLETDAQRPGKKVSPMERYSLKGSNVAGDDAFECEEELEKKFNAGGFPYVSLRLANVLGPKENSLRYWLLHLWVKANLPLTMPLHLDTSMLETPISITYTPDIAQAVVRVIAKSLNETCCPEAVHGEAFNLACELAPTQRILYNNIAEPIGLPYVETQERPGNESIVLYPDSFRGPVSSEKARSVLRWAPTDFSKALRSVSRFYERAMIDEKKHPREMRVMYAKCEKMLGPDGERFVTWIREHYAEKRKKELYDELDDEDEDEIVLARGDPDYKKPKKEKKKKKKEDL
eukprot:TRINITY_DN35359_c0_g1_i1.p1 TRINITY_DN35359_c0_g1~~TRINITY_DN35359_c0_g1_i1.p1  ORF type:complete len:449 (-),score=79.37 TRINITY_DN35359_c0_g1_i1:70-1416(-)